MTRITLRVLDGADRGRVFDKIPTPVTIGREEGNVIQLNDERISRFHVKIQEDHERLVLTDLESTNGTRVNGEDIQLRILKYGDIIHVGRSVLLFGSRDEIAKRLMNMREGDDKAKGTWVPEPNVDPKELSSLDFESRLKDSEELQIALHNWEPPELPAGLTPAQAAQISDLLSYLHIRIRLLLKTVDDSPKGGHVTLEAGRWQDLLDLQARLAEYLRAISDPDPGESVE
jgi:pSer/pThr/pTyr-binding forkhead associated (FHA) protein